MFKRSRWLAGNVVEREQLTFSVQNVVEVEDDYGVVLADGYTRER